MPRVSRGQTKGLAFRGTLPTSLWYVCRVTAGLAVLKLNHHLVLSLPPKHDFVHAYPSGNVRRKVFCQYTRCPVLVNEVL